MLDGDKLFIIYYIDFPESLDTITVSECIANQQCIDLIRG